MATPGPVGVAQPSLVDHAAAKMARDPTHKRRSDTEIEDQMHSTKRERHESGDEGSTCASNDEHNSTDSDVASRENFDEDTASLASIMISIANSCGKRAIQSQPSSAETVVNISASSSVTDDDDHAGAGDSVLVKKQRRREKNRASAQQSRQRKKHHLETLELRVEELERDRAGLLARIEQLTSENRRLRTNGPGDKPSKDTSAAPPPAAKTSEVSGAGLLDQLAQAAHTLSALS